MYKKTEDSCPTGGKDWIKSKPCVYNFVRLERRTKIRDIASHGRTRWNCPYDGADDGQRRPYNGKNDATEWSIIVPRALVQEVRCKTEYDGRKHELCNAKDERDEARDDHIYSEFETTEALSRLKSS
jgi:hypothetical protein